jgi:hypothetical protein
MPGDAEAGAAGGEGFDGGFLSWGGGLEIAGEALEEVRRGWRRSFGAEAVFCSVAAADGFAGGGSGAGGAKRVAFTGGDLGGGAHGAGGSGRGEDGGYLGGRGFGCGAGNLAACPAAIAKAVEAIETAVILDIGVRGETRGEGKRAIVAAIADEGATEQSGAGSRVGRGRAEGFLTIVLAAGVLEVHARIGARLEDAGAEARGSEGHPLSERDALDGGDLADADRFVIVDEFSHEALQLGGLFGFEAVVFGVKVRKEAFDFRVLVHWNFISWEQVNRRQCVGRRVFFATG